jgi:hypothetical protein
MTKKMTKIAMMLVLGIGLMASAATAQDLKGVGFGPVGIFDGVETAQGNCETITQRCYGDTFVLNSFGENETHHLTVSLNYLNISNHNGSGMGVISGSWTLVVFRDNQYAGTLYGEIRNGNLSLLTNDSGEEVSKQVQVNLISTGGMGIFKGKEGENIGGVYSAITDLRSKETSGSASFNF